MTPTQQLQTLALAHTWGTVGCRHALLVTVDRDLYDVVSILVTDTTREGCIDAALVEMAKHRNTRPRLVSITTIAERWMGAA